MAMHSSGYFETNLHHQTLPGTATFPRENGHFDGGPTTNSTDANSDSDNNNAEEQNLERWGGNSILVLGEENLETSENSARVTENAHVSSAMGADAESNCNHAVAVPPPPPLVFDPPLPLISWDVEMDEAEESLERPESPLILEYEHPPNAHPNHFGSPNIEGVELDPADDSESLLVCLHHATHFRSASSSSGLPHAGLSDEGMGCEENTEDPFQFLTEAASPSSSATRAVAPSSAAGAAAASSCLMEDGDSVIDEGIKDDIEDGSNDSEFSTSTDERLTDREEAARAETGPPSPGMAQNAQTLPHGVQAWATNCIPPPPPPLSAQNNLSDSGLRLPQASYAWSYTDMSAALPPDPRVGEQPEEPSTASQAASPAAAAASASCCRHNGACACLAPHVYPTDDRGHDPAAAQDDPAAGGQGGAAGQALDGPAGAGNRLDRGGGGRRQGVRDLPPNIDDQCDLSEVDQLALQIISNGMRPQRDRLTYRMVERLSRSKFAQHLDFAHLIQTMEDPRSLPYAQRRKRARESREYWHRHLEPAPSHTKQEESTIKNYPSVFLWSYEKALSQQVEQIGTSACGATAIVNVLKCLGVCPEMSEVTEAIRTNLRLESAPLPQYLFSRSVAGTTAEHLVEGVHRITNGSVYGRFFSFYPARDVSIMEWLASWMSKGAVPLATLNLQKVQKPGEKVADAWHHQMIYGVSSDGIFMTNPLLAERPANFLQLVTSDSTLLIRRCDVISRWNEDTDLTPLMEHKDQRWIEANVLGQVVNIIRECSYPCSEYTYRRRQTSHVSIPAAYKSGITLFVKTSAEVYKELIEASELPLKQ